MNWKDLPIEIVWEIMLFLQVEDITTIVLLEKRIEKITNNDIFWKQFFFNYKKKKINVFRTDFKYYDYVYEVRFLPNAILNFATIPSKKSIKQIESSTDISWKIKFQKYLMFTRPRKIHKLKPRRIHYCLYCFEKYTFIFLTSVIYLLFIFFSYCFEKYAVIFLALFIIGPIFILPLYISQLIF